MDKSHRNYDPAVEGLTEFAKDALTYSPEVEPDKPRDAAWLRWLKFASLIVFPAVVFGLGFLFADYAMQEQGATYRQRSLAAGRVRHDSVEGMRIRFIIGAALGGGFGLVYVGRCIIRRVDP